MGILVLAACAFALSFIVQGLLSVPIEGSMALFLAGNGATFVRHHLVGHFYGDRGALDAAVRAIAHSCAAADANAFRRPDSSREYAGAGAILHVGRPEYSLRYACSSDPLPGAGIQAVWVNFVALAAIGGALFSFSLTGPRKSFSEIR